MDRRRAKVKRVAEVSAKYPAPKFVHVDDLCYDCRCRSMGRHALIVRSLEAAERVLSKSDTSKSYTEQVTSAAQSEEKP